MVEIAIVSDEAGIFDMIAGRYGKFPNLDVYLKAWSGSMLHVDRKGHTPMFIDKPALSIAITFRARRAAHDLRRTPSASAGCSHASSS